jgi:hypothetical protein
MKVRLSEGLCRATPLVMALVQIAFWRALARRIQTLDVQKWRETRNSDLFHSSGWSGVFAVCTRAQPSTTMHYAHLQDGSLRTATEQFGKLIKFRKRA